LAQARSRAAETGLEEIRVMIAEAGLELDRADALVRDEVMSQAELDRVQARMDTLKARLDRQQEEAVVAEREVALWEQQIDDTIIRAPFDGVVTTKDAQPGEMISPISGGGQFTRTGIGTVVDMSSLEIEVDVNESYINRVEAGQSVVATLDAYPDWEIPCRVIAIVPTADRERATVRVRIGFMELDERVLPDMGVKVSFQSEELGSSRGPAVLVPKDAIRQDGDQSIVYLVDGESRAERRAVRTAEIEGDDVRILAGVSPGERVIVQGPREIQEGDLVRESVQ
jgi:RND family efflux transporter MFP subunit